MDPDAALAEMREIVADTEKHEQMDDPGRLVDLFQGLDQWLSKGGFLPTDWSALR